MNTFGQRFTLTTFGESHGLAVGGIIDGCPAGVSIDSALIDRELARRRGHPSDGATPRQESDHVELLSGLYDGMTLGTPIAFVINNNDVHSGDYEMLRSVFRPGHADYTYQQKYGCRDWRGGGRSSARETAARVVAGAIAKQLPSLACIDIAAEAVVAATPHEGDSVGGHVRCAINGLPAGIGEPIFDKLGARLAYAMMSIPSATAFEMGVGKDAATMTGTGYADAWTPPSADGVPHPLTATNHCGGIQGGISNGMPVVFTVTFHPVVTHYGTHQCLGADGSIHAVEIHGRHDMAHVRRVPVIVESMAALVVADLMLQNEHKSFH